MEKSVIAFFCLYLNGGKGRERILCCALRFPTEKSILKQFMLSSVAMLKSTVNRYEMMPSRD
jgi:hypothetical protein